MIEIRSYRRVFALERRIYRVDRLRLNPSGVPVMGVLYFAATLVGTLVIAQLPLLGSLAAVVPWYGRCVALPLLCAALMSIVRIDGRPVHMAVRAVVSYRVGLRTPGFAGTRPATHHGRSARGARWRPPPLLVLPDGSEGTLRRLIYTGPGAMRIAVEHERRLVRLRVPRPRRPRWELRLRSLHATDSTSRTGTVIELERSVRARVR